MRRRYNVIQTLHKLRIYEMATDGVRVSLLFPVLPDTVVMVREGY